ncbi:MAG: winged helix-turn-helix transcriptional regulator [Phycisphaerales bacterium]
MSQSESVNLNQSCDDRCPVQRSAAVIDSKWTTLILRDLFSGTKRFSELEQSLRGISSKVLADRLKMLEANGLITRRVESSVPPKTFYTLTDLGHQSRVVIESMAAFGSSLFKHDDEKDPA